MTQYKDTWIIWRSNGKKKLRQVKKIGPDQINAYEWQDLRLVVYSGQERREIVFLLEELIDDSQEGRERLKGNVEVLQREKGDIMK